MSRTTPARRRSLLALLVAATLLLGACGGGGSDDGADGSKSTTTAGGSTKTTEGSGAEGDRPASLQDFGKLLKGSGFDDEQVSCVLDVAQEALGGGSDVQALDKAYSEACGLTNSEVVAGAYYAAMIDRGIPEKDADCVRDLYAALTVEQAAVFSEDDDARDSLLEGCNIDPADLRAAG